jgi:hypothetical protein
MVDTSRYPRFNDHPHNRPVLGMFGSSPWSELIWLAIPVVVIILALLVR